MSLNGAIAEAVVLIRADGSTFQSDVVHQGTTAGVRAGSAFGENFKRRAKATLAIGGAAIFAGLGASIRTGFTEVQDYEAGWAKLRATFKSTKTDVGLTAKDMERLASRIEAYSGQTDDSIVAAETQLKTFKLIRNEVGEGNKIFTLATKASADMSAQWGGDASQNAIRLGKALNDPIAGATALGKIGVKLTDQQKEQIKSFVDSGKVLRAQKIILGEVESEAGGVARAYGDSLPGQIDKTKRAWEGISQELVEKATPALLDLAKFVRKDALPALEDLSGWVKDHKTELEVFAGIFAGLAVSVKALKGVRSVQGLLGRGALGGGGGVLGAVSMAKPLPVYVVNSLPGAAGSGALGTAGKAGFFARIFGPGLEKWLPRAGAVALGADAVRTGVDAVRGHQSGGILGTIGGGLRGTGSALSDLGGLGGDIGGFFKGAGGLLGTIGGLNKQQHALAGSQDEAAAAAKREARDLKNLNQLLVVNPGLLDAAGQAHGRLVRSMRAVVGEAKIEAAILGHDLGRGLIAGIEAEIPHATVAGKLLVASTVKSMRLAADANSPSRETQRLGQDLGDGLIKGLRDKQRDIDKQVNLTLGQLGTLRSAAQSLNLGVRGAILGDSSILNTPNQTVGGIKSYYRHVLGVDRQFTHRIDRLRDGHRLPKGLLNDLEQDGPIAAGNIVRQLARANRGDDRAVGHLFREIHQTARRAGQTARQETYDPQIKGLQRSLDRLNDTVDNLGRRIDAAENKQAARTHR